MRLHITVSLPLLAGFVAAKTIEIAVGKSGNTFEPASIAADVGDLLSFTFYPEKHAVVSSNFERPCKNQLGNAGFSSDFVPVAAGKSSKSYVFKVTSTDPLFFYCPQSRHCQSGMVGVVNPNDSQTLEKYKQAAANVPVAQAPPPIYGLNPVVGNDLPTTTTTSTKHHTSVTTSDVASTTSAPVTPSTPSDSGTRGNAHNQTVPTKQSSSTSATTTTTSTKRHTSVTTSDVASTTSAPMTTSTPSDSRTTSNTHSRTVPTKQSSSTSATTSSSSHPNSGAMGLRAGSKSTSFAAAGVVALSAALAVACGVL